MQFHDRSTQGMSCDSLKVLTQPLKMLNDVCLKLTLYLIETPFNTFANRAVSDQAAHDNTELDITLSCCGSQVAPNF